MFSHSGSSTFGSVVTFALLQQDNSHPKSAVNIIAEYFNRKRIAFGWHELTAVCAWKIIVSSEAFTTITPSLEISGTYCLSVYAKSREAFAVAMMKITRHWDSVRICEPTQRRPGGWWYGYGRVWNEIPSSEQVIGAPTIE
jgi:hypothetical protein